MIHLHSCIFGEMLYLKHFGEQVYCQRFTPVIAIPILEQFDGRQHMFSDFVHHLCSSITADIAKEEIPLWLEGDKVFDFRIQDKAINFDNIQ